MRPRTKDRHLPPCVYLRHGAYWLVKRKKWTLLGRTLESALQEYARLHSTPQGGLDRYVDEALAEHRKGGDSRKKPLSDSTWRLYTTAAGIIKKAFAEFSPEQVKPKHIALFKRSLADRPGMANHCLVVLRVVFNYLLEQQLIESNPAFEVKRFAGSERERLISKAEFDEIRAKAAPRLQVMMDLMYLTGQRLMDVVNIHESHITDEGIYFRQAKTDAKLLVSWTPELRAAVAAARALNGKVRSLTLFRGRRGTPPKYKSVYRQWRDACTLAGIQDAQARDLRAMSATATEEQGKSAQKLLGHTTPATTRRYLRSKVVPVVAGPAFKIGEGNG